MHTHGIIMCVTQGHTFIDATPSPKLGPRWPSFNNVEVLGLKGPLPTLSTKRGRGAC